MKVKYFTMLLTLLFISCVEGSYSDDDAILENVILDKPEFFVEITTLENDDSTAILNVYDDEAHLVERQVFESVEPTADTIISSPKSSWESAKDWLKDTYHSLEGIKKKISYTEHMQEDFDLLSKNTFSEGYLHLLGYYKDFPESGRTSYGEEINDKVRVTLINGILNLRKDLNSSLEHLSNTHGNTIIHYVFRPTEGWSKDLCNSILAKFGYISPYARLLAAKWKEIIEELGGTESGGVIIHYAHSIGTTDTYMARNLLTKEEQKMIHVISIGSPSMIPKEAGFASSINYVSKRDGVCLFDPLGYIKGWFDADSNVEFLGSYMGIPFVDHMFSSESYDKVIRELGLKFSDKYHPHESLID